MLLSFAHVVLAVWILIRNYEAEGRGGGGQLKISHLICTEIRKLSILVVYCSGSRWMFEANVPRILMWSQVLKQYQILDHK